MPPQDTSLGAELVSVQCPRCRSGYSAEVTTIIDASDEAARDALLGGGINTVSCPSCGNPSRVATPMLYLDRDAELAYVLVPDALGLNLEEQEQRIGQLTNRAVNALPADERRMYMLQPRTFVSEKTFFEAVLEANGVSQQEVERIQDTARLIESLLGTTDENELAQSLSDANRKVDQELIALCHALARDAAAQGDELRAKSLAALRDTLARLAGPAAVPIDELLDRLLEAREAGQLAEASAALAPVLDYGFYTQLTERIDACTTDEQREELVSLRAELVAAADAAELKARAEFQRAVDMLQAVTAARDVDEALRIRLPVLDSAFFYALQSALQDASKRGDSDQEQTLSELLHTSINMVESQMPPRDRLVNKLARTPDANARNQLLDENRDVLDAELEQALRGSAFDMRAGGATQQADALDRAADEVARRLSSLGSVAP